MNCICYAFFFFLTSFLGGIGTFSSLIYIQLMKLNVKQIILFQDEISTVNWNWFSVILALIISAVVGLPPFTISTTLCQQPIKLPITFVWKLELSSSKPGVFFFSFLSVTVEELRTNVFGLETAGSKRELPPNKPSYWSDIVQVLYVEKNRHASRPHYFLCKNFIHFCVCTICNNSTNMYKKWQKCLI